MPRRGSKKRYRRRRRRTNGGRLTKNKVMRILAGDKRYLNEVRGKTLNANADVRQFEANGSWNSVANLTSILTSSGAVGNLGSATDLTKEYRIVNHQVTIHYRNVSNHPVFFYMYDCLLRNDYTAHSTATLQDPKDLLISHLVDGWDVAIEGRGTTTKINTVGTGTVVNFTDGDLYCETNSTLLTPFQSPTFCEHWKVVKSIGLKLEPGDDFTYKLQPKAATYDHSKMSGVVTGTPALIGIGGSTRVVLTDVHGALGKGIANDTISGWMACDVAYECVEKARVYALDNSADETALVQTVDDVSGGLEAGARVEMKEDDG